MTSQSTRRLHPPDLCGPSVVGDQGDRRAQPQSLTCTPVVGYGASAGALD